MTAYIRPLIRGLENLSEWTGRLVSWFTFAMVIITMVVVVLRYGFSQGSVILQESVTYLHAAVFLLCVAWTLKRDAHVRVDIFYRNFSAQGKAWVNALGSLIFLLPLCAFLFYVSFDFVAAAWRIHEGSPNANGIPAVFVLKTLIPLMAITLAVQGVSETLKSLLVLAEEDTRC